MWNKYIEENRGFITASKLKTFLKSPEEFYLLYIKEEKPPYEKEKKAFKIWTALDDYLSYWKKAFEEKYFFDEWLLKAQLVERLETDWVDCKWLKVDELKRLYYWDVSNKIKLSDQEYQDILWMINELKRQPIFDINWKYENQKTFIWKYKNLQLKGTLDRFWVDTIRDYKTTGDICKFIWDWESKLKYDISMSFYWILVSCATGQKPELILDVVQSSAPYPFRSYKIPKDKIWQVVNQTIIPALDTLDRMMTAWELTKDESIWKVKTKDFYELAKDEIYPLMSTTIQTDFDTLQ